MAVIRDVIRDVLRPVLRDVIRDASGGGLEPGDPPRWSFVGPTFQVYEFDLPFTLDMNPYVTTPPGEPVTAWSNTGSATIGPTNGILSLDQAVGSYPITVTATNINDGATSNEFTIEVLSGEQPAAPEWDTVPNYYSVFGIEEGNRVPTAAGGAGSAATIYAAGEGVDMNEFILNSPTPWPVTPGSWIVTPGNVATIDTNGILKGKAGTTPGQYSLTVTCSNENDSATSNSFTWTVVSQEGYSVDFDKAAVHPDLNGLTHTRGASQTFLNYLADPTTEVTGDFEALVGQDWNGSAYIEKDVGYGILMERNLNTLAGALQVLPGMELEACGHLVFRLERLPQAGENYRYFTLGNTDASDYSEIYIASGASANTFTLGVRTLVGNAEEVTTPALTLAVGDIIDLRYKVNGTETDKLTLWYSINGAVHSVVKWNAYPVETQTKAATDVFICGQGDGTNTLSNTANVIHARLVPTGYLDSTTILGWDFWSHPAPILPAGHMNPEFIHLPDYIAPDPVAITSQPTDQFPQIGGTATFTIGVTGSPPYNYDWQSDISGTFRSVENDFSVTGQNTATVALTIANATVFQVRCIVDNTVGSPQTSDVVSCTPQSGALSVGISALFTDLTNAKRSGFANGSDPRGAAVTVFGHGFGADKTLVTITVGGEAIPNADIYAIENAPFPQMQMLTFHINENVPLGDQDIIVTVDGNSTDPLSIHVRDTGRIMFFDAANGSTGTGDGSHDNPFWQPADITGYSAGSDGTFQLGDHWYFKAGTYTPEGAGQMSGRVLYFYGGRTTKGGTAQNGLSFCAYPGHAVTLDNKTNVTENLFPAISFGAVSYTPNEDLPAHYTISKFNIIAWYGSCGMSASNHTRVIGVRTNGLHATSGPGTGDLGWGKNQGNNGNKILGCEIKGGTTRDKYDHAIYPGGGGTIEPGAEIAYNYIHSNDYRQGPMISVNYKDNNSADTVPESERRVATGEYVKGLSIHHNLIDARSPVDGEDYANGWRSTRALTAQSMGDDRPDSWLPQTGQWHADPLLVYNNVIVGSTEPNNQTDFQPGQAQYLAGNGISIGLGAQYSVIANNTVIDIPYDGAGIAFAYKSSVNNSLAINQTMTIIGNTLTAGDDTVTEYFVNANYVGSTVIASGNCQWGANPDSFIPNETVQTFADPNMTYDLDNLATVPITVPEDSPVVGLSSDPGIAGQTRDFYGVPYSLRFEAGAIQSPLEPGILFQSDFSNQADWESTGTRSTSTPWGGNSADIPDDFHVVRHLPFWSPTTTPAGDPGTHECLRIHSEEAGKAKSPNTKSLVQYREWHDADPNVWGSDAILHWYAGDGNEYDGLYVEFDIQFSDKLIQMTYDELRGAGALKILRMYHWNGSTDDYHDYHGAEGTAKWPMMLWGLSKGQPGTAQDFGFRNKISFRPHPDATGWEAPTLPVYSVNSNGDWSGGWHNCLPGMGVPQGSDPEILDKKARTGALWPVTGQPRAEIDNIFGTSAATEGDQYKWTKLAFWMKLNSSAGARDGEFMQWVDGERVLVTRDVEWVRAGASDYNRLNMVAFCGNSQFDGIFNNSVDISGQDEDWISFDNIVIRSNIPEGLDD